MKTYFCCNQKVKNLNAVWKIIASVKNQGKPVEKTIKFYIYLIFSHNITQNIKKDMLVYEFSKAHFLLYNQLTTPKFYIEVLVLLKIV